MLTKNIASEYGEFNIQCNGIGPGYIATPQTAPLREVQADGSRHPFDQFIIAKTPAGRWVRLRIFQVLQYSFPLMLLTLSMDISFTLTAVS